jgi:dTDP-4-amino-4,6-dideoxygalactose transaminase
MPIPILDLNRTHTAIAEELNKAIARVFSHNIFILGPEVQDLEKKIADYVGARHAIGVASGTDALLIALRSIGVGPGDEVITTPFSFFATVGVISRLGARPVFVDIEPDTFNIDPDLIEAAVTDRTKAIMPVHLYGQCAEMDPVMEIAGKHGIKVVEDAAQAIGARYKEIKAGTIGDLGCFSFFPTKNLGACGDAGMIVTNDDKLEEMCRKLRVHGAKPKYYHKIVGYNSRLDALQAAILGVKFNYLDTWHQGRRAKASKYDEMLSVENIKTPVVRDYNYHIFHQYTVRAERRDQLQSYLREKGISTVVYYPLPLHIQECFSDLGYKEGDFPVAEKASKEVLSLPVFPELRENELQEVVENIEDFYR